VSRISGKGLLPDSLALQVRIVGAISGQQVDLRATFVYQVRGNVLSAVYAYGGTAETRRGIALRAAAASARNLRARAGTPLES